MQSTAARFTVKRDVEVIDVDNFVVPVVDVDLHHAKYENTEDDGIESIDRHVFRQSFRKSKEKEKDVVKRQSNTPVSGIINAARATPDVTASRARTTDYPSTIGPINQSARVCPILFLECVPRIRHPTLNFDLHVSFRNITGSKAVEP